MLTDYAYGEHNINKWVKSKVWTFLVSFVDALSTGRRTRPAYMR